MKKTSYSIRILAVIMAMTALLLAAAILVSCGDDDEKKEEKTTVSTISAGSSGDTAGAADTSEAVTTVFPSTVGTNEQGELTFPDFGTGIELPDIPIG